MLSNGIHFISNKVKGIQSYENRIKFFKYLKNAISFSGFIFLQETHSSMYDEKSGTTSLKENYFSHTVKVILAESLLVL